MKGERGPEFYNEHFGAGAVAKPCGSTNAAYEALKMWVLSAWKKNTGLELPEGTQKVVKEEEGLLHTAKKTIKGDDCDDDGPYDIEFMTKPRRKSNKYKTGNRCNEPTINNWDCFAKREWDECLTDDAETATVRDAYHAIHVKEAPETEVLCAACLERRGELGLESITETDASLKWTADGTMPEGTAGCHGGCHDVRPSETVSPNTATI
ncbi:hypothetical protein B0A55_08564 [Friedmanniomyces simplex]|uniref:Uncharacterized protein n=1 Tax=Friedmanniomyces simplex TaxID=329884 RepID=A0A4U0WUB6_9PEZI|nr:hypothetical protein B0A55_08564 [Friedmanniomyces simplex]